MTLVPWLLSQFIRSIQIKKSIANASHCYYLLNNQTVKKGWFLGQLRRKLKKLLKFHRKKTNNWPMVSFIHNGSEITAWYNFKTKSKSTESQATFLRKTYFLNFKLQIIRLAQRHWSCTPTR